LLFCPKIGGGGRGSLFIFYVDDIKVSRTLSKSNEISEEKQTYLQILPRTNIFFLHIIGGIEIISGI